jgi:hypothetical protein
MTFLLREDMSSPTEMPARSGLLLDPVRIPSRMTQRIPKPHQRNRNRNGSIVTIRLIFSLIVSLYLVGFSALAIAASTDQADTGTKTDTASKKRKSLGLEYSVIYSQSGDNVNKFRTLTNGFELTYDPTRNVELFVNLPLIYERRTKTQDSKVRQNFDIGDIDFGLRLQNLKLFNFSVTPSVKVKSNTGGSPYQSATTEDVSGDGLWAVQGELKVSRDIGKLSVFTSGYHKYYFDHEVRGQEVDRKNVDAIEAGIGYYILDSLYASVSVEKTFIGRTEIAGFTTQDRRAPLDLTTTATYFITSDFSATPYASFGLNKESEDFAFGVTIGYKFDLL